MNNESKPRVDFPDGEIVSYLRNQNTITVSVRRWDERISQIVFSDVVGLADFGIGDITCLLQKHNGEFVESIIDRVYEQRPDRVPYQLFQFLDLDDESCLEIVAIDYEVSTC